MCPAKRTLVRGFSLLELLAVIATIATLAALLFPVLGKAKGKAQQTTCLSNLRQLGLSWMMYYGDNSGRLVESYPVNNPNVWVQGDMRELAEATNTALIQNGKLYPYNANPGLYRCATDRGVDIGGMVVQNTRSYSMNGFMGARDPKVGPIPPSASAFVPFFAKDSDLRRPSELWVLIDEDERSIGDGFFVTDPSARIWFNFPSVSSHRHNFRYSINFADGHAEPWGVDDARTRLLAGNETEQTGNVDLSRLARASTVKK